MYGVIEGIETEAQFAIARRHGWQLGQGFLFGHAVPASEIPPEMDLPAENPEVPVDAVIASREAADEHAEAFHQSADPATPTPAATPTLPMPSWLEEVGQH
jgi:hypothetical protein